MKTIAILLSFAALMLTACTTTPGADGRYATHDRGNGTIDKALRR